MSRKLTHTRTKNGHRWELVTRRRDFYNRDSQIMYVARAQRRCTRETCHGNTVAYFRNLEPIAEFDTTADRDAFLANFTPEAWAAN